MSGPRVEMLAAFGPYEGGWRDGEFHNPEGLASDSDGNIWVCDETNYRIQLLSPEGRMLRKIGAVGRNGRPRGGTAPGQFWMIRGVAVDDHDNVYVGDTQNSRVQAFDSNGCFRFLFGSEGNGPGQMSGLDGVAVDSNGFIYVTDTHTVLGGNNRMLKFDQRGRFLFSFGGHGTGPGRFAGKTPVVAGPEGPYGIDIGALSGLLYVADTYNDRVQVFDRDGGFVRSVGEGVIFQPRQICLDSRENIYVAGFHMPPSMRGVVGVEPLGTWGTTPENRFLWVLDSEGRLLVKVGAAEADALAREIGEPEGQFDHAGGRHHAVTVSKADEGLVYFQCGHQVLKYRIHW
jgi:hypothetical protein